MKNEKSLSNLKKASTTKKSCVYCTKLVSSGNLKRHENACDKNPVNLKECPVCKIMHSKGGVTCSYACSNTHFRSGVNNPNWSDDSYQTTCWHHHGKKCLVCGEEKIVAVHHVNENHNDNRPENLVPLCPTHHQYVHSKYKDEIQPIVESYVKKFISL
jgi:hypothetical protein